MKRVIRRGVFETNSSSVHSLTMCTQNEWDKWKKGEMVWRRYERDLVDNTPINCYGSWCYSFDEFWKNWFDDSLETFHDKYTTPSGEVIHAFGYYGRN